MASCASQEEGSSWPDLGTHAGHCYRLATLALNTESPLNHHEPRRHLDYTVMVPVERGGPASV